MMNSEYIEFLRQAANDYENELSHSARKALSIIATTEQLSLKDSLVAVSMFIDFLAESHDVETILVTMRDYLDKTEEEFALRLSSPSDEMH